MSNCSVSWENITQRREGGCVVGGGTRVKLALKGGEGSPPSMQGAQTAHLESFQRLSTGEQWDWLGLNFLVQIRVCVGIG